MMMLLVSFSIVKVFTFVLLVVASPAIRTFITPAATIKQANCEEAAEGQFEDACLRPDETAASTASSYLISVAPSAVQEVNSRRALCLYAVSKILPSLSTGGNSAVRAGPPEQRLSPPTLRVSLLAEGRGLPGGLLSQGELPGGSQPLDSLPRSQSAQKRDQPQPAAGENARPSPGRRPSLPNGLRYPQLPSSGALLKDHTPAGLPSSG
jgi:hypothetical protein